MTTTQEREALLANKAEGVSEIDFLFGEIARLKRLTEQQLHSSTRVYVVHFNTGGVYSMELEALFQSISEHRLSWKDIIIYTDAEAANRRSEIEEKLGKGREILRQLDEENLTKMVDLLESTRIDELLKVVEDAIKP